MKAVILAAGRGIRLGKLTETKPKCLLEIDGTTRHRTEASSIHQKLLTPKFFEYMHQL